MRHHDHHQDHDHGSDAPHRQRPPYDGELVESAERSDDLTEQFWGAGAGWSERAHRRGPRPQRHDDTTGTLRVIRDGVAAFRPQRRDLRDATGQIRRTRAHGGAVETPIDGTSPIERSRADATIGQLAAGHFDEPPAAQTHDRGAHELPHDGPRILERHHVDLVGDAPGRRHAGIDPLLARLGAMLLVGALMVPLALALRPSDAAGGSVRIDTPTTAPATPASSEAPAEASGSSSTTEGTNPSDPSAAPSTGAGETIADTEPAAPAASAAAETTVALDAGEDVTLTGDTRSDVTQSVAAESAGALDQPATVEAPAERIEPECPQTYTAAPGDSWYRIADAAGVSPGALLSENRATVETIILPGDDICLPAGATMPSPPSTTSAPTTTEAPSTTNAPTTTAAPTTTSPAGSPGRDASVAEVKAVIRSIFPESQWETAYVIADRESRFVPTAYNGWCCHGVFQIYWNVHRSWLDDYGIDSADDLYDPVLNVRAAYAIYQRAGNSWSPWSTYDG